MPDGWSSDADPYVPLQYFYRDDAWKVTICCLLLNLSNRRAVGSVVDPLFAEIPAPSAGADRAREETVREIIAPTGLQNRKAHFIWSVSDKWFARWGDDVSVPNPYTAIGSLPGCGSYVVESVRVFCINDLTFIPKDRVVAEWVGQGRRRRV